jgi:hypothetical protein
MRSVEQRLINAVQRPEAYCEVVIGSVGARILLSGAGMRGQALLMHWLWPATRPSRGHLRADARGHVRTRRAVLNNRTAQTIHGHATVNGRPYTESAFPG